MQIVMKKKQRIVIFMGRNATKDIRLLYKSGAIKYVRDREDTLVRS